MTQDEVSSESKAEQKSFSAPSISLPKGGGALRGMGEKFAANPVTGTGSLSVPIATSPGRSGFGPQLALCYDSGTGNGPFGFGWTLSIPKISRKTDMGLPRYRDAAESDVYLLSGAEDLVPVLEADGRRFEDSASYPGYTIHRYRPRIEGLFARIERWTNQATGEMHWRSISRENITTLYGKTEDSRIADPADPARVFTWLICESYDDKGNAILYEYKAEDSQNLDLSQVHERNRSDTTRSANRYLKRIRYGNHTPYRPVSRAGLPETSPPSEWLFEVVLDYGEHDPDVPTPAETQSWPCRPDPFSTYRPGFEVRTYRLCQRVLMFHHFPGEPGVGADCLVRSTDFQFSYQDSPADPRDPIYSFIRSVLHAGYRRLNEGGYRKQTLPPLEFEYSQPQVQADVQEIDPHSLENLPSGLDGGSYQWLDLDGEGLSGVLTRQAGGWYYKRNLSPMEHAAEAEVQPVILGPLENVASIPSLAESSGGGQQFLDLAGDGQLDLVDLSSPIPGFFERTMEAGWYPFVPFTSLPAVDWDDPQLRFLDLTGDGHTDILITEDEALCWYPSLGEAGFGPSERLLKTLDEDQGPRLTFADGTQSIFLADMSGDNLMDIVRIRNGEVSFWPNLGYGRFGARVVMDDAPWFDLPDAFDHRRLRLSDIDGSGTADLIYLGRGEVRIYFNQSGNRWSPALILESFPALDDLSAVHVVDLLGSGTACVVWSSNLPGDRQRPMRYIDLMGGQKPHLLVKSSNNLGAETRIQYAPSTKFYVADKLAGKPWQTRIPFPVHVVERVETYDHISGNRFFTRYAYHHGYFDGVEREFRGFGLAESWDTAEFSALNAGQPLPLATNVELASHVPPVYTKRWFHTGVYRDRDHISTYYAGLLDESDAGEYYREPGLDDDQARALLLEDTLLPPGLSAAEEREACRALKGMQLRQEVYALDGTDAEEHPYTVSEQNFTVHLLQPQGRNRHAVFFTHAREALSYHYERNPDDPRLTHNLNLEVDEFGNVKKSTAIGYGRRQPDINLSQGDREKQAAVHITLNENDFTNPIDLPEDYRTPLAASNRVYELTGVEMAADAIRFSLETLLEAAALAVEIPYETPPSGSLEKRLIEHIRTLYRPDDFGQAEGDPLALLPLGHAETLALPGEIYRQAFTPGLVAEAFGDRVSEALLAGEGFYVHCQGDPNWWVPSGRVFFSPGSADDPAAEQVYARDHFFLTRRVRDPFHRPGFETESFVTYDAYDLLLHETRDALGNRITAENEYRVLQPVLTTDPNGNQAAATFDVLGMVAGTAVMGKAGEGQGDSLDGFQPDLDEAAIAAYLADPMDDPHTLLGTATTRLVYDLYVYLRTKDQPRPSPVVVGTLARETHESDLAPGEQTRIQQRFTYADGFGREIQKKIQAEPGPVDVNGPEVSPRWVGSGWTVFNNKGQPVRQFEPFFSSTHHLEFDLRVGVSPILFYDPLGRVVGSVNPNHTWQKVVFDAWRQETWDVNDTVLLGEPQNDPHLGGYFSRLPEADYLPTWHAARIDGALGPQEQEAAQKTALHAGTPSVAHLDSLARTFLTVAHNRTAAENGPALGAFLRSVVVFDIERNQREVIDARERVVMRYDYDMLGNVVHTASMDSGERWMLNDVTGKFIRAWDNRDHQIRSSYDRLGRPTRSYLRQSTGVEQLVGQSLYGETQNHPETKNLRGRVVQLSDQSGILINEEYDFKGNLLRSSRQLAAGYKSTVDLSREVELDAEVFLAGTSFDALNRPLTLTIPGQNVIHLFYNDAGLLERIESNLSGAQVTETLVQNLEYNAKGQRESLEYGNNVRTTYQYDPSTFRLQRLQTIRGNEFLQDLIFTYDPVANITQIQDDAQQTIFFNNTAVEAHASFTYDALYRLTAAEGREHIGQVSGPETTWSDAGRIKLAHPHDGQAMRRYSERYEYDKVGNLLQLIHQANNGNWTRVYAYNEPSFFDFSQPNNRLSSTAVGNLTEPYNYDEHGSMIGMPHLPLMLWNFLDQLQAAAQQVVNEGTPETTYYVYDAAGQRVRKVTERYAAPDEIPSRRKETIYLNGFEIYREYGVDGSTVTLQRETLHLLDDKQRIGMVETRTIGEDGSPYQLIRYQCGNHLGSTNLELDGTGQIISYEEYFPFGCSSYQAVETSIRAAAKRYRYTGKERDDESGLYYHGARYYAPWLGRWVSADPLGINDGLCVYAYTKNNPINFSDPNGTETYNAGEFLGLETIDGIQYARFKATEGTWISASLKELGWERYFPKEAGYGAYVPGLVKDASGISFDYPDVLEVGQEYLLPTVDQVSLQPEPTTPTDIGTSTWSITDLLPDSFGVNFDVSWDAGGSAGVGVGGSAILHGISVVVPTKGPYRGQPIILAYGGFGIEGTVGASANPSSLQLNISPHVDYFFGENTDITPQSYEGLGMGGSLGGEVAGLAKGEASFSGSVSKPDDKGQFWGTGGVTVGAGGGATATPPQGEIQVTGTYSQLVNTYKPNSEMTWAEYLFLTRAKLLVGIPGSVLRNVWINNPITRGEVTSAQQQRMENDPEYRKEVIENRKLTEKPKWDWVHQPK